MEWFRPCVRFGKIRGTERFHPCVWFWNGIRMEWNGMEWNENGIILNLIIYFLNWINYY
jgi:hypothetical protein